MKGFTALSSIICLLKNKNVSGMMEGGDHAANERVNVILFGYLLSLKQRLQTSRVGLMSNSMQTVVCTFLHVFEYLTFRCEMYDTRSQSRRLWMNVLNSLFNYSRSSNMYVKLEFSMRNKIANEEGHQAIFRYMFAKKQKCDQDDGGLRSRCQWTS